MQRMSIDRKKNTVLVGLNTKIYKIDKILKVAVAEVKLEMLVEELMAHASRDDWINIIKLLVSTAETNKIKEVFASFQSAVSNQQLAKMESDDCFITVEEFRLAKQNFGVKP